MNTDSSNNFAIVCITENGKNLALKIKEFKEQVGNSDVYIIKNSRNNLSLERNEEESYLKESVYLIEDKLSSLVGKIFNQYDHILFIMATGIVVRVIAPFIKSKFTDPGVLVTDDKGTNVISLLSGHVGGANEMAIKISELIGGNPVITTATDVNDKASLDMIAKKLDAHIDNFRDNVKDINSMLLEDSKKLGLFIDGEYEIDTRGFTLINDINATSNIEKLVVVTDRKCIDIKDNNVEIIKVVPRDTVVGIGCRRNTSSKLLQEFLNKVLHEYNIDKNSIKRIGSIDIKHDEKAIIELALELGVEFKTISPTDISKVDYLYEKSEFVKKNVGVYSVSEPVAHILSNGNLVVNKQKHEGITISIGRVVK